MGIEIISGFDLRSHTPLDEKAKVTDEAGRLAIKWVSKGLLVFQEDTGETFQYQGTPPSNLVGDWVLFTSAGIQGPPGNDGADGVDGDKYATVSTSSITIPTIHPTTINLTVGLSLAYTAGQPILIANTGVVFFNATVTSYDPGTGALVAESTSNVGTGTFASWIINLAGTVGIAGNALIHIEGDIILDDNKIVSVEAGTWTPIAPYAASVVVDFRNNHTIPTPLNGSMVDHSIAYDGTSWFDNGIWRGPTGVKGDIGSIGPIGATGSIGPQGIQGFTGIEGPQGGIGPQGPQGDAGSLIPAPNYLAIVNANGSIGRQKTTDGATWTITLLSGTFTGTYYHIKRNGALLGSEATVVLTSYDSRRTGYFSTDFGALFEDANETDSLISGKPTNFSILVYLF